MHDDLSLADLLSVAGVATDDVLLVRHTFSADSVATSAFRRPDGRLPICLGERVLVLGVPSTPGGRLLSGSRASHDRTANPRLVVINRRHPRLASAA